MTIAVGLATALDDFAAWWTDLGFATEDVRVVTVASIEVAAIEKWIGVPPPDSDVIRVHLVAPEPHEGEEPQWLYFHDWCCWTSDLIAARVG